MPIKCKAKKYATLKHEMEVKLFLFLDAASSLYQHALAITDAVSKISDERKEREELCGSM